MTTRRRRPPGEGSVYFDQARGAWVAARTVGVTPRGNPRRIAGRGRTQVEARQALERKVKALGGLAEAGGLDPDGTRVTLSQWLDRWLEYKLHVVGRRPGTVDRYRQVADVHLKPTLGDRSLRRLRAADLEALLVSASAAGLSRRSVRYIWSTAHGALAHAVRRGLVGVNIADQVQPPTPSSARPLALDGDQVARLLAAAAAHSWWWCLYRLAVTTGMRRGELVGLSWSDVDLDLAAVSVTATTDVKGRTDAPKTQRSRRALPLAAGDIAALRRWHDILKAHAALARAAGRWTDSGRVFPSKVGTPLGPRNLVRDWRRICHHAGLGVRPFHALRHTAATLALRSGVPVEVVSARLGHQDAGFTYRTYSHVLRDMADRGAVELESLLEGPSPSPAEAPVN